MSEIRLVKKNKEKPANIKLKVKETTVRRINDVNEKYVNDFATAVNAGADKRGAKLDERANNIRDYINVNSSRLNADTKKALEDILGAYDTKYKNGTPRLDQELFEIEYATQNLLKEEFERLTGKKSTAEKLLEKNEMGKPKMPVTAQDFGDIPKFDVAEYQTLLETMERSDGFDFFDKGAFSDGAQWSDAYKAPLGTLGDAALGVGKGLLKMGEGVGDLAQYGIAGAANLLGAEEFAEDIKYNAKTGVVDRFFAPADKYLDKYSVLGDTSNMVTEGVGQILGMKLTAGLGALGGLASKGTSALTLGEMFLSGMGSGMSEAYNNGASDLEATAYGAMAGAAEAISESMFGGLGKGVNALGISRGIGGLDDIAARAVTQKIKNTLVKNGLQALIKAGGEGLEEVASGLMQAAAQKFTYMSEAEFAELVSDQNLLESFTIGLLTSAMAQVPSFVQSTSEGVDFVTGRTDAEQALLEKATKDALAKATEESETGKISLKEKNAIRDDVLDEFELQKAIKKTVSSSSETESGTETLPVGEIGEVSVGVGKGGAYEVQLTETEGETKTVDVDSLSRNSPEYKILRAAEDSHMTPAVADAVLRGYDGSVPVNEYVAEAEYVSAAAKAGTAYEAILKGSDTLSEDVRRAIWEDGRTYSENITKARQTFLDEVKAKSDGKVMSGRFDTKEIKGMKLNRTQERAVKTAEALSSLGFNIRMVKSIGGDSRKLGYYDKRTGDIVVSVNARSKIEGVIKSQILPTMAHEITHSFRATSPELYSQYRETVLGALYGSGELQRLVENEFARLRDSGRFAEATDAEIYDAAYDELVARASEDMLADPKAIEKICRENRTVGEKILEAIDRFISTLKSILSGSSEESVHEEARILRGMLKEYEAARELWVKALADSAETRAAQAEQGDVVREDGTPVASGFDSGEIQLNEATYEDEGRDVLSKYLNRQVKSKKLSRADADDILNNLDRIYDTMKTFAGKYAPYAAWAEAKVIRDGKGKPVFSVVTPNGDYSMNIDFSLVCKKRRMLDAVFNRMIERGLIDDFSLGKEEIVKINNIIKDHKFEIACALCFVDAKRFRQAGVADSFVDIYNGIVNEITPDGVEVPYFNFGGNKTLNTEGNGLDGVKVDNSVFQRYINEYGEKSVKGKVAKHLRDNPADRKLLHRGDFLSTAGFDAVKRQNPEILSLFNSKKGSGGPKSAFSDTQYLNEIIASRTFNAAKAFAVGGVRVQSFSDYIPRLVFDYCQMVGDLAAKKLPAHAYSKEDLFVKQFGKTGIKINMSLIPKIVDGGVAPGLDADGNYAWADESFDFDTAKEIQNADGYTDNCGTICVGVSREHILKLLGDPDIRMVIPYHKSGLNPIVAQMNKIAEFKDYTNAQNTRYTNEDGTPGSKLSDEDVKSQPNVNALMQKGMTAKEAAQAYLDWCDQKGYTPKFDEFAGNENYYKLLIDFVCYNKNGNFVPQGAVKMNFPNAEDKFGSMAKLIESGLEADAVTQYRQNKELDPIVDEITEVLGSDLQFNEALDDAYMDAVNNGDMETAQRLVDEAAKKAMPDSKLTTEDGRLRTVYHGTNTGNFTVFNPDYIGMSSGDDGFFGMGFYFAYTKGEAAYYGARRIIPAYLNITNPFNFDRELQTYKGKKASGGYAPDAVAFMNFADKFPDIAKNVTVEVVEKGDDTYKDISLIEFAEAYKSVIENKKFKYEELTNEFGEKETLVRADPKTHEYEYNGEKRSYVDYGFHKRFWGTPNDLDVAYEYLAHSVYDTVDMYSRTRLIIDNNREFTAALKEMGYDGAIQSEDGDEAVVFDSSQIKSADPITYDDNGNVIPLSERFNSDNPDIRYNEALDDELTMREVLTGALEGAALTEADAKVLERYRRRVREIDGYDERLREVNREIKEISFAKGKRDTARLSELKSEKAKLEQDLKRADRKLLELSSTEALKNLFDREAKRLRREKSEALRAATKEARRMSETQLKEVKEKNREKLREVRDRRDELLETERRKAAERELKDRTRRERNAIKRKIEKLTSYITTQTDKKNVKEGIKGAALEFMRVVVNDSGTPFTPSQLGRLRDAYAALESVSEGSPELIYEGAYDFDILEDIKRLEKTLAGRAWRDLTLEELDIVEEVTDNLKHMIQEENRIFRVDKSVSRKAFGKAAEEDVKKIKSMGKNRVKKLLITENLTPDTFFGKLGGIFESLYWDAMKGQNKAARVYVEAKGRVDETVERFGGEEKLFTFKHGSYDKKHRVFKTEGGQMFELTADEAMYLYAVYKRETISGKTNHILGGGIKTDGLIKEVEEVTSGGKTVYKPKGKTAKGNVSLTELDISRISASLTDTQRAFADSLVKYLSDDMAKLGNETSMKLYGIKKYKESYYIPFKISATDRHTTQEEMAAPDGGSKGGGKNVAITSKGFSKELHRGANNPIVVSSFMDVFSDHVVEMANYNAFALTSEAFRSIENHRTEDGILLKSKLNSALGENGYSYYKKFLSDLNGGLNAGDKSGFEKLIALQKKGAIFMSLSVAIQQPVAIVRAANEIDPKYLFAVRSIKNTDSSEKTALWEEMKRYAPGVTVTKEMGRFDTATGLSAKEYIYSRNENIGEVVMDVADTIGGFLPEWADKLAWMQIWKACKAEVSAKRGLTGEALMNAVGERFTEVINKTQVYDSFLSKSGSMRNQNDLSKMATAFMAEPVRNLNMLYEAYTSKDGVKMARATTVFLLQTVINSALVSLIRAIRDDDEEKTFKEKYVSELTGKIIDEISLWNSVPYLRDISSILQGYDVDRTDMTLIGSVASKGLSMLRDDEGFTVENITDLIGEASTLTGVSAKNLIRDVKGIWRLITTEGPDSHGMMGLKYVAHDELFGNSTTGAILKKAGLYLGNTDYDGYIEALESGDVAEAEKIFGAIIEYKVFKARRKAEAEGKEWDEDEARKNAESSVRDKVTEHLDGSYDGYLKALDSGDTKSAEKFYGDITELLVSYERVRCESKGKKFNEKKAKASAESSLQSRVTKHFKKRYVAADYDERTEIRQILRSTGLYENVRNTTKAWVKFAEEEDE